MLFVSLTSLKLKRNPLQRARFYVWATRRFLQADKVAIFADTNSVDGKFLIMTVWEDPSELEEFETKISNNKSARKVSTKAVYYSYETLTVPSWDEAIDLLETASRPTSESRRKGTLEQNSRSE